MTKIQVEPYNCESCALLAPMTYMKCLNGVVRKRDYTMCEKRPEAFLSSEERVRRVLITTPSTQRELLKIFPNMTAEGVKKIIQRSEGIRRSREKGTRAFTYFIEENTESLEGDK